MKTRNAARRRREDAGGLDGRPGAPVPVAQAMEAGRPPAAADETIPATDGHAPDGHLELRIWLRLLACSTTIEKLLKARMRAEFGTGLSRFDVLAHLDRFADGLTMTETSRRLMVSNGATTGLVDKLVAEGLVERLDGARDRRTVRVRLTPEGRQTFRKMAQRHEEWVVSILGDLSREAQSELLRSLTLLKRNLDLHAAP